MPEQATPATTTQSSAGELVQQLAEQLSHLVRDEMKLAQAEMTRKGTQAAKGLAFFSGSGLVAAYGMGCLLAAAIAGLATAVPVWLAALIVGGALFVAAGVAALVGRREVADATPLVPERTVASLKADAEAITEGTRQ
jgi:Putative Actinobacterial Holin-X, holin superfamily III